MIEFKCKRCGECCKAHPCIAAQVNYGIHEGDPCPSLLLLESGKYHCTLIEIDEMAREAMINGCCSHPERDTSTYNAHEIVLEYFPCATDEMVEFILWDMTPFPCDWNYGEDGYIAIQCLKTCLKRIKSGEAQELI